VNKVWRVRVCYMDGSCNAVDVVADDDVAARATAIKLLKNEYHANNGSKVKFPNVNYCNINMVCELAEEYYDLDSVEGG
jgi:hypothetical protein